MTHPKVCLIVDNPLRDLDGLVLVAWQLAQRGVEAWLVPMYEQSFDIRAIGADFVLLNYVRANNLDHALAYKRAGMRVGVLDTEGVGGKSPDEFASLVRYGGGGAIVDVYCVWGRDQHDALAGGGVVPADRLRLTGCPRYDFCAAPWRSALPVPPEPPGYVLINTNFPIINPRFSGGSDDEVATMVRAGFARKFAREYVADARHAHGRLMDVIASICVRFPGQRFILRPHPFESADRYKALESLANFRVRQEGTSLEWLSQARALIHLNCSTAVEAAMLGKPALSLSWLDTPALHVPGPHKVSRHAASKQVLFEMLEQVLAGDGAIDADAGRALHASYFKIDGMAAERVAIAILDSLGQPTRKLQRHSVSMRSRARASLRWLLGFRVASALGDMSRARTDRNRRRSKFFTPAEVLRLVERLCNCVPGGRCVQVTGMSDALLQGRRHASNRSVRVSAESA